MASAVRRAPDGLAEVLATVVGLFVGEGWHLTLGLLFMIIVIFLPGGLMFLPPARHPPDRGTRKNTGAAEPWTTAWQSPAPKALAPPHGKPGAAAGALAGARAHRVSEPFEARHSASATVGYIKGDN